LQAYKDHHIRYF